MRTVARAGLLRAIVRTYAPTRIDCRARALSTGADNPDLMRSRHDRRNDPRAMNGRIARASRRLPRMPRKRPSARMLKSAVLMRRVIMRILTCARLAAGFAAMVATCAALGLGEFGKPLRIVVPYPPGGSSDVQARLVGAGLADRIGQPAVVDNRPGASGIIGAEYVARQTADGRTLLLVNAAVLDALGSRGYLINVARGSVMDEPVPVDYLQRKRIAGAGLDTFQNEPRIDARFIAMGKIRGGSLLMMSGMGPHKPDHKHPHVPEEWMLPDDPAAQARMVLDNMKRIVEAAGGRFQDIVKITRYFKDISHQDTVNGVIREYFGEHLACSTTVQVAASVVPTMLVETDGWAVIPDAAAWPLPRSGRGMRLI